MTAKSKSRGKRISPVIPLHRGISGKTGILVPCFIFIWPFLYLFKNVFPIGGDYTAIGQDFMPLFYTYKAYLVAGLADGHLPLWSPSEGAGYPFFSSPFTQSFYPLNLLLIPWYKIVHEYSPLCHQVYTVAGIGIFALGLFFWLRQIIPNSRAVLVGVLILSVSFKVTEILRFPNGVHTAAWYPWILYAITRLFCCTSIKKTFLYAGLLFFSFVCLCTAGYPYYMYYSIFLFGPYVCIFLIPPLKQQLLGPGEIRYKRGIFACVISVTLAGSIVAPYLVAVQRLMSMTVDRGGKDFAYSTAHIFTIQDTVGSLIYPPVAQAEGWYFFSITGLLVILLLPWLLYQQASEKANVSSARLSAGECRCRWLGFLFLLFWVAVISFITYGKSSWLFIFLWNYMPGFSSLRVWGRMNIILVPLIAWLLAIAYGFVESLLFREDTAELGKTGKDRIRAIIFITVLYLIIIAGQIFFYSNNSIDPYWKHFPHLSAYRIRFIIMGMVAYSTIMASIFFSDKLPRTLFLRGLPLLWVTIAVLEMWPVGAHTWIVQNKTSYKTEQLNLTSINTLSFLYPRTDKWGTASLSPVFNVGPMENWYFENYNKLLKQYLYQSNYNYYKILLGMIDGQKVFFSQSIAYDSVQSFLQDSARFPRPGRLVSYNGDMLVWHIETPAEGYLSFIDNWDPYWKAYVDGKEVPIKLLFDTFKSIALTPGVHQVIFRYEPTIRKILFGVKTEPKES